MTYEILTHTLTHTHMLHWHVFAFSYLLQVIFFSCLGYESLFPPTF